jgi:hypothetical protein
MELSQTARKLVRSLVRNAHSSIPVVVVDGGAAPRLTGESYYWTTPSGKTRVRHPKAYGWYTRYWHSTLAVEVGRDWIVEHIVESRSCGTMLV